MCGVGGDPAGGAYADNANHPWRGGEVWHDAMVEGGRGAWAVSCHGAPRYRGGGGWHKASVLWGVGSECTKFRMAKCGAGEIWHQVLKTKGEFGPNPQIVAQQALTVNGCCDFLVASECFLQWPLDACAVYED